MATKEAPYVVVRTYSAGVHCGELSARRGKEVDLVNAKRIWRLNGANTLNEIANHGVAMGAAKKQEPKASARHTPGPWEAFGGTIRFAASVGEEAHPIATMADEFYSDEAYANARLIAAAPELAECLHALLLGYSKYPTDEARLKLEERALAVLKKAGVLP